MANLYEREVQALIDSVPRPKTVWERPVIGTLLSMFCAVAILVAIPSVFLLAWVFPPAAVLLFVYLWTD